MKKLIKLRHPESPGMNVIVSRNWFQRLIRSSNFATLSESLTFSKNHEILEELYNEFSNEQDIYSKKTT